MGWITKKTLCQTGVLRMMMLTIMLLCWESFAHAGYSVVEMEPVAPVDATVVEEKTVLHDEGKNSNGDQLEPLQVTINLRGAVNYETVEIFNKLLHNVASITSVERIRMIVTPSRPGRCVATWEVRTFEKDTFLLESQLYANIKKLDYENSGDVLGGMFFNATVDDIEQVKNIKPVSASLTVLNFTIEQVWQPRVYREDNSGLLYAGFD